MDLHVRLDNVSLEGANDAAEEYLRSIAGSWVLSHETSQGKNPHSHYAIISSRDSPEKIRRKLRNIGFAGNKSYSVSERKKSKEELVAYIIKDGKYETSDGFSTELLERSLDLVKAYKMSKEKKKGSTKYSEIEAYVNSMLVQKNYFETSDIVARIYDYYIENNMLVRKSLIDCYVDTYLCKHSKDYKRYMIDSHIRKQVYVFTGDKSESKNKK